MNVLLREWANYNYTVLFVVVKYSFYKARKQGSEKGRKIQVNKEKE